MKRCSKCKQHKDESEFWKNKNRKDGLADWCKPCYRAWEAENRDNRRAYHTNWKASNRDKTQAYNAKWLAKNKEKKRAYNADWRGKNSEKYRTNKAEYERNRRRTDVQHGLQCKLRVRMLNALSGNFKTGSAVRDLGISIPKFKAYIESLWLPGMTWDNWKHDGWHLDVAL